MSSTNGERALTAPSLQPTRYDRVASLLIATLILSATSVVVLAFLWFGARPDFPNRWTEVGLGGMSSDKRADVPTELEMPQLSELSQLAIAEPIVELSTLLSRDSITAAIAMDVEELPSDSRRSGPRLPPEAVPRWERWEIRYEAANLQAYALQLDFLGIELGAIGRKPLVDYASHFTNISPTARSGTGSDEKRLYLTWRGGSLRDMDRDLLAKAGIDVAGRTLLQFYPQHVEDTLARLEQEHTKDGRVDQLRKTIFGVRQSAGGCEFFVIEQR